MEGCRLSRCCFCFDLRRGAQLYGVGSIFVCIVALVGCVVKLDEQAKVDGKEYYHHGVGSAVVVALALVAGLEILFSSLLLWAVAAQSRWCLVPWLVFKMVGISGLIITACAVVALSSHYSLWDEMWSDEWMASSVTYWVLAAGTLALTLYVWFVVLSLFLTFSTETPVEPFPAAVAAAANPEDCAFGRLPPAYTEKPRTGERSYPIHKQPYGEAVAMNSNGVDEDEIDTIATYVPPPPIL